MPLAVRLFNAMMGLQRAQSATHKSSCPNATVLQAGTVAQTCPWSTSIALLAWLLGSGVSRGLLHIHIKK
jgi:hypothetical protein